MPHLHMRRMRPQTQRITPRCLNCTPEPALPRSPHVRHTQPIARLVVVNWPTRTWRLRASFALPWATMEDFPRGWLCKARVSWRPMVGELQRGWVTHTGTVFGGKACSWGAFGLRMESRLRGDLSSQVDPHEAVQARKLSRTCAGRTLLGRQHTHAHVDAELPAAEETCNRLASHTSGVGCRVRSRGIVACFGIQLFRLRADCGEMSA